MLYIYIYASILEKIHYLNMFVYIQYHISTVRTLLFIFLYLEITS